MLSDENSAAREPTSVAYSPTPTHSGCGRHPRQRPGGVRSRVASAETERRGPRPRGVNGRGRAAEPGSSTRTPLGATPGTKSATRKPAPATLRVRAARKGRAYMGDVPEG